MTKQPFTQFTQSDIGRIYSVFKRNDKLAVQDYAEQLFWLIFLKILDDADGRLEALAEGSSKHYQSILEAPYRWATWTSQELVNSADLCDFINKELFPYLKGLGGTKEREEIGEIFKRIGQNKIMNGSDILEVIGILNQSKMDYDKAPHILVKIYKAIMTTEDNLNFSVLKTVGLKEVVGSMAKVIERVRYLILLKYNELFF